MTWKMTLAVLVFSMAACGRPAQKTPDTATTGKLLEEYIKPYDGKIMVVRVTDKALSIGDKQVVALNDDMLIDASHKRGGANSLYIQPFYDAMGPEIDRLKPKSEGGDVKVKFPRRRRPLDAVFAYDGALPVRLFNEVLYTGGQRSFDVYWTVIYHNGVEAALKILLPKLPITLNVDEEEEKKKKILVGIFPTGLRLTTEGKLMPPIEGCPEDGDTICNLKGKITTEALVAMRKAQGQERADLLREIVAAYNWRALYNSLIDIKKAQPEKVLLTVSAEVMMPMALIAEVGATGRFKRPGADADGYFKDDAGFQAGRPPQTFTDPCNLPDPEGKVCLFPYIENRILN